MGGYVKISGMIDESMDTEQMEKDPQPWEFRSKPAWQRLIIMLGGVTVNIILGFAIYMMIMFIWGKTILPSESIPMGLNPSPVVEELGFEKGDKIQSNKNENITIEIERNKRPLEISLKPNEIGQIGVSVKIPSISFENKRLSLTESLVEGFNYGYWTLHDYI